jgi:hypothetical protein
MADEVTLDVFAKDVANGSKEARLALAQQLKDAKLWTGKVTSDFNIKYYNALVKLEEKYKAQVALNKLIGSTAPVTRYDVLVSIREDGDGGEDGPTTTAQRYITSPSQTAKMLDTIAEDLLERKLTKAERAYYLKIANAEQQAKPTITTAGEGFSTTKGGADEEQVIADKIAGTAEAKTVRATDAYTILMQELGGLR